MSGERALATVIITLYNYEAYVRDAVESALAQTYENVEVLVLDNASTDGSVRAVEAIGDRRVRLIRHPTNIGIVPNHNAGIEMARGAYLSILSADDMLLPTAIADGVEWLERHPEMDVLYRPYIGMNPQGAWMTMFDHPAFESARSFTDRNEAANLLARDSYICLPTVVFRKALLSEAGGFDARYEIAADYELFIRLALAGKRFAFEARPAALVRFHGGNRSGPGPYVATGKQLGEYTKIFRTYVQSAQRGKLAGYAPEILANLDNALSAVRTVSGSERAAEIEAQHRDSIDLARRMIADLPPIGDDVLRGSALVSVIVPFAGRHGDLRRALSSLCAQSYEHWEGIVVCDGAADPSPAIDGLTKVDRIRVVCARTSGGPSAARNLGLRCANGEVVTYLDDDDLFSPEYLDAVRRAFADPSLQATRARSRMIVSDEAGVVLYATPFEQREFSLVGDALPLGALAHRRSLLHASGYFNLDFPVFEAWEFLLRLARVATITPLAVNAYSVGLKRDLSGQRLFGRRTSPAWNEAAGRINAIYAAHLPVQISEAQARKRYLAGLGDAINAALRQLGKDVRAPLRLAEYLSGRNVASDAIAVQ